MDNSKTIKSLEKKQVQLDYKIMMQKNKNRFVEKKRKISLGKIFILAGANKYINQKSMPFNYVISLGGLFYIADINEKFKLSILLGATHLIFNKIDNAEIEMDALIKNANAYYEHYSLTKKRKSKETELASPFDFFLGVILAAQALFEEDKMIDKCHKIGDDIFNQLKRKKHQ